MNRVIAFFDFDGTVTTKDTLLEFIRFVKGDLSYYFGFLIHAPMLVLYKMQLFPNQRAKEIMLNYFFGNMDAGDFERHCNNFMQQRLPSLIRKKAMKEITQLKKAGAQVVIVSASPENWLLKWCEAVGVQCIASKLSVINNRITGRIDGRNCHGEEKVRRIQNLFRLEDFSSIYAYGDTGGDRHMLSLAHYKFYKPFR